MGRVPAGAKRGAARGADADAAQAWEAGTAVSKSQGLSGGGFDANEEPEWVGDDAHVLFGGGWG